MPKKNSKQKGKRGELQAKHYLTKLLGIKIERSAQNKGGADSHDLDFYEINFEVKREQNLSIKKAMEQSIRDCSEDQVPTVFHRKNRTEWLITVPLSEVDRFYNAVVKLPGYIDTAVCKYGIIRKIPSLRINLYKELDKYDAILHTPKGFVELVTFRADDLFAAITLLNKHKGTL